ncbi:MAG: hypothetical protein KC583_06915, partial [Myxococcales bacterium]|nr:hypothetical protein [Myxococcales bacterium]
SNAKLIALVVLAAIVGLVGIGAAYAFVTFEMPVEARDRAVLLTANDLEDWLEGYAAEPGGESVTKQRLLDRSVELTYEYDDEEVYISCEVNVETSNRDAKAVYLGARAGLALMMSSAELATEKRPELLEFGDECLCEVIRGEGDLPVGNLFLCRVGNRVFDLTLVGTCFEEAEQLRELLLPILQRFAVYEP